MLFSNSPVPFTFTGIALNKLKMNAIVSHAGKAVAIAYLAKPENSFSSLSLMIQSRIDEPRNFGNRLGSYSVCRRTPFALEHIRMVPLCLSIICLLTHNP